jgi:NADH dehydrogenase FAD-containing subunit
VVVDAHLQAASRIWVGGDNAATQFSGWGQTAAYDGAYIARNLQRAAGRQPLLPYKPKQPVGAIPVGPKWCAVSEEGRSFYGYRGWLMRRWMDMQLYRSVMPFKLAYRAWLHGNRQED